MLAKKVILSTLVIFVILTPLAYFTDLFTGILQSMGAELVKTTENADSANASSAIAPVAVAIVFAGPILILFLVFWHLWIQRNKKEVVLAIVARAKDVHDWLRAWAEAKNELLPGELRDIPTKAGRIFKKLDRVVSLDDKRNWHWWYSLYLASFYFSNAPTMKIFRDLKTDPPTELWPRPEDAVGGLDADDSKLLKNALEFSSGFADGAKAYTGLRLMMHTVVGSTMGLVLSVIVGGLLVLALIHNLGSWVGILLSSLTFSLVIGLISGFFWHWVGSRRDKTAETYHMTGEPEVAEAVES